MTARILVINPNSTAAVTEGIDAALAPLRVAGSPEIDCATLAEGPPGVESQRHVEQVTLPLCRLVEREDNRTDAFVIACFSDPGLHAVREATRRPVFGIAAAGIATALNLGERIGVIAILPSSLARHWRYFRAMGVAERIAGDRPANLGVTELADEARTLTRLTETGKALCDEDRADVVVLGCAGMAKYRTRLEAALARPVIDPTQAAVAMAIGAVQLGYRTA
ncbi:MAG TPA: aspartate/glutamate racemase family protein [Alphaproteobacteria bacterium]|nr:aspartate/glutamate racemase family protein [Alphaproteobacteria bacterium]